MHALWWRRLVPALLSMAFVPTAFAQGNGVERLRIHGSNALGARLAPALVESWLRSIGYEGVRRVERGPSRTEVRASREGLPLVVEIDRRGSASGMRDLIDGRAELAMLTRAPTAREREDGWQLGDLGSAEQEFVVALDGVAVIVPEASPVRELRVDQLRKVLSGRVVDWDQLAGAARPIRVHLGSTGGGTREFLRERILRGDAIAGAIAHPRLRDVAAAVMRDSDAIGVVSLRTPLPAGVRALAISDGGVALPPTRLQVLSEDYPLVRRLTLQGGQMMGALGRSFALYTMTGAGQRATAGAGHIALTLRLAAGAPAVPNQGAYADAVAHARRLPLSLRFNYRNALNILDSRSERDLDRLAAFMRLPGNRQRGAVVVAFSAGGEGTPLMATLASNDRADLIASELQLRGVTVRRARGLGALRPLAGASSPEARFRNERVEVWML